MSKSQFEKNLSLLSSPLPNIEDEELLPAATLFWIEDPPEKIYLSEENPDVVAVSIISWEFAQLINNRNYNSLDGSVEYHLYNADYLKKLVIKRDERRTTKFIKKNKLKSRCEGSEIKSICFNKDSTKAEVLYTVQIVVLDATDKFFKNINKRIVGKTLEKNVPYEQLYKLNFVKETGAWKITKFEFDSAITVLGD